MTTVTVVREFTGDKASIYLQKPMEFDGIPRFGDSIVVQEEAPEKPGYLLLVNSVTFRPYPGFKLGWTVPMIDIFTEPEPADRAEPAKAKGWKEAHSSSLLLFGETPNHNQMDRKDQIQ